MAVAAETTELGTRRILPRCSTNRWAHRRSGLEGTVVKGRVIAIENDFALIDVGLKSEGRVPLKEFAAGGAGARDQGRRHRRGLPRADGGQERRGRAVAREGAARGGLDPARKEFPGQRARHRHDLRPRQGRLHGRSQRRRRVPAGQPGRYPPGARHHPAAGLAAAVPDPQDGPLARQHRRVAPRRARREPRRAALRAGRQPEGRPDPQRRRQEHHRLRRLRRSRRRRRPAARHRHRLAAHQPPVRGAQYRPERQGAGHPLQPGDAAHLARHEAARSRSVGRRRAQIPGRRASSRAASPTSPTTAPLSSWSRGSRAWSMSPR